MPVTDELALHFSTSDGRAQYFLGEPIKVNFSYSTAGVSKNLYVDVNPTCGRGYGECDIAVKCEPNADPPWKYDLFGNYEKFQRLLVGSCNGKGILIEARLGGVIGGIISSPPGYLPQLGPFPLASYARLRAPGRYTCFALSTQARSTVTGDRFLVKSNPLELTIVDDPAWSRSAALADAGRYERLCSTAEEPSKECTDIAERLNNLDTLESLEIKVKYLKHSGFHWNHFWDSIWSSAHQREALRLIQNRIQDPDFRVDRDFLQELAIRSLELDSPGILETGNPSSHETQALDRLREYVRLLGSALPRKDESGLEKSLQTYRVLASLQQCNGRTLIPDNERELVLGSVQRK